MTIRVTVLYFGQARDDSGLAQESFTLPAGATVRVLVDKARLAHPRLEKVLRSTQVALNEELASGGESLSQGDVIALLPPVAGG